MPLEELNKKIYDRQYQDADSGKEVPFTPEHQTADGVVPHAPQEEKNEWTESSIPQEERLVFPAVVRGLSRAKKVALVAGGIALLALLVGGYYKVRSLAFANEKVSVEITGPQAVETSRTARFVLTYTNHNFSDIENAELIVNHPESFRAEISNAWKTTGTRIEIPVGKIDGGETGTVELTGEFQSTGSRSVGIQAVLHFQPKNSSAQYKTSGQWTGLLTGLPLTLEIVAPLQAADGQTVEYEIHCRNEGLNAYDNLRVTLEYPDGFHFTEATLRPTDGTTGFYIGGLQPDQEMSFRVTGTLNGLRDDVKKMMARIGKVQGDGSFVTYGETEEQIRIAASPFFITQSVNGQKDVAVRSGDSLAFGVNFRNDGEIGLRDVLLSVTLDPTYLDLSTVSLDRGTYQSATRQILFKASDLPALARLEPGQSGSAQFSVKVRSDAITVAMGKKNVTFETIARIDSPDVPTPIGANKTVASNTIRVKLLSEVAIDMYGVYTDTVFPNTGPLPLQLDQETTFSVHVKVASDLNDITGSQMIFRIPSGIRYIGSLVGERETVRWNSRAGELVWEIGTLLGGQSARRELVFRVGLTPNVTTKSGSHQLMYGGSFLGKDEFSGQDFRIEKDPVNFEADLLAPVAEGSATPQ